MALERPNRGRRAAAHDPRARPLEPPAELTEEQLRELKGQLQARRANLVAGIESRRLEERDAGRDVGDEMDEASLEGNIGMSSKLLERDVQLLSQIDHALAKFDAGTFGVCEGTGEPIGYERLRLQPWARYSVAYQEELEREARARGA